MVILVSDFEYYYTICEKESKFIDKFVEVFNELLNIINTTDLNDEYHIVEKKHRFIEESYKNILEISNKNIKIIIGTVVILYIISVGLQLTGINVF